MKTGNKNYLIYIWILRILFLTYRLTMQKILLRVSWVMEISFPFYSECSKAQYHSLLLQKWFLKPQTSSHENLVGTGNKYYLINGKIYNSHWWQSELQAFSLNETDPLEQRSWTSPLPPPPLLLQIPYQDDTDERTNTTMNSQDSGEILPCVAVFSLLFNC